METIEFVKTETALVVLPDEIKELAKRVPESKQAEVQNLLTQIFAGTDDWERQVDAIEVKGINDIMSMQLAGVARKNAKNTRLAAEKLIDAKREEVQSRMQDDKVEDALWLKSKQIAQIKFRAIEEKAEWKERFKERYEAEQKELTTQLRIEKVGKFTNDINRIALENMSDQIFDMFLSGIEKTFNDKLEVERKQESDRLAAIEAEKVKQESIRIENEKLKKAIIERDKKIHAEKAKADKERAELLAKTETERKEKERLKSELAARITATEKLKKDAELKLQADKKAKEKVEKAALKAPDKVKLTKAIRDLSIPDLELKSKESRMIDKDIRLKFVSFKLWCETQIKTI